MSTMEYHSATERNVTCYNMLFLFSCQVASDSAILWTTAHHASLFPTIFWSLPKFMSIESVMTPNHLIPCYPPLLLFSIFPSIRVFSNESALCIRWPKLSPCSPWDSEESSPAPQFKSINSSAFCLLLWSSSHIHTWLLGRPQP